ncbi:MAG: hypothetical protein JRI98_12235, partial [Deltaproteobacteria bacterium]|nr:hypothetical protein [Deltaproteobacteria bacterium]
MDNAAFPGGVHFNATRYQPGQSQGHYESFFQRANHPDLPRAFWIRYTIFSPHEHPEQAIGELWAIYFDGETGRHVVAKSEHPIEDCAFNRDTLSVRVGGAELEEAKSLVGHPLAIYRGTLDVDGEVITIDDWVGSQNHNWGSKHTDEYAWGQVAGFDSHPETFFEVATARLKIGPIWTPRMTLMTLRHQGRDIALNSIIRSIRARESYDYFNWTFASEDREVRIEGEISAAREDFVGLTYYNPPGGNKHCLNCKIAQCTLHLTDKGTGERTTLTTQH